MLRRDFINKIVLASAGLAASRGITGDVFGQSRSGARVMTGIDVLAADNFKQIAGKRIGLVTHPAGVNMYGQKTIDVLRRAPNVRLVKLFGPEHGIYGDAPADKPVNDVVDPRTGIKVFSLYGKTRRPTPEMLSGLDAMLVDLQDIGSRSYTYISCMRYVAEACFNAGVKVYVLDRPNPLGGLKADGPILDKNRRSYVGAFCVPYVHGLTIGELAFAATKNYDWLDLTPAGRKRGRLEVIKMRGWQRAMRWDDTGLKWIQTSPMVRTVEAAEGYAMTGLGCQVGGFTHGLPGGISPFRAVRFSGKKPAEVQAALAAKKIRGLGLSLKKNAGGEEGVFLNITDWARFRPTEVSFHMMQLACAWNRKNPFLSLSGNATDLFNKHTGCEAFFEDLRKKGSGIDIAWWLNRWETDALNYQKWSREYWLYA